jgi:pimeloyl-ACP methyl ester carboxylesterase
VTLPPASARPADGRLPAAVLIAGRDAVDRDDLMPATPVMAQMAGALAARGFLVVRYDNRGSGQSGGRTEAASLSDYADDARTIVRWLANRKDVDRDRIAVVGHGDGAWMALLTASREGRVSAVVTLGAAASRGEELILEQQRSQLERSKTPEADRAARETLQKQVNAAVLTGRGWESISEQVRKQADTAWFRSLLAFDPAKVAGDIEAPLLIVHGDLDREVPVAHAERLSEIARKGDSKSVALVTVRGVNHLMLPAFTGEIDEYAALTDRSVSRDVSAAVVDWLPQALAPSRGR